MVDDTRIEIQGQHKAVKMGLGDALQRLMKVEHLYATGVAKAPEQMIQERNLIIEALNNQFELNLGFDCNDDDVPDTVEIFQKTAATSCCRILPTEIQKQVKKGVSGSRKAQKKSPEEVVGVPVRQHSGLKKTTTPRTPAPVVKKVLPPSPMPVPESDSVGTVVRIFRGLKKVAPEPSTA